MDPKKRIDKVLSAVHEQIKEEVSVLLGVTFGVSDTRTALMTKESFLDELAGKQILARIDVAGDIEGAASLLIGIKDAIRLGGTLIMLPDSELEEVVGREEYTEETEDSYGEIANIIAGSYTKVFEEMYPKNCRFIRKEQEIVVPAKIDIDSDDPLANRHNYVVSCSMTLGERPMGELHMMLPAEAFGLLPADEEALPDQEQAAPRVPEQNDGEGIGSGDAQELTADNQEKPTKRIDPAKHKKRVDRLLAVCAEKLSEEVSSLLGSSISFSDQQNRLLSKEDLFFEELQGKQVMADMEVVGDLQDTSFFFASMKSAIHLGGVLIMLPPSELESTIAEEDFSEDLKDSYGEVANIVSGVYTNVFEEQYTEKLRFIKKSVQPVVPLKVDIGSEEPITDQQYYVSSMSLVVDNAAAGMVHMVLPAEMLHLAADSESADASVAGDQQSKPADSSLEKPAPAVEESAAQQPAPGLTTSPVDQQKQRKRIDRILKECAKRMEAEVGALLGSELRLTDVSNQLISKEDFFFDVANGKQVMASMDVVGEIEDSSYLFVSLKDAIFMGGSLIMLPPSELESAVSEEEFSEDGSDAYGEIANIIAGVYTTVFEEQYNEKFRFIKTGTDTVVPMKVDIESDLPVPDTEYYLNGMSLVIDDQPRGKVHMLFPAEMLKLESVAEEHAAPDSGDVASKEPAPTGTAESRQVAEPDILVISDSDEEAEKLIKEAAGKGMSTRKVTFKDDIRSVASPSVRLVYIFMREVNEQAFGMAIKVSSSCSAPLVAAGPGWTRSKVIKAVKYGVNDILLTPATAEDIRENLDNNLVKLAA